MEPWRVVARSQYQGYWGTHGRVREYLGVLTYSHCPWCKCTTCSTVQYPFWVLYCMIAKFAWVRCTQDKPPGCDCMSQHPGVYLLGWTVYTSVQPSRACMIGPGRLLLGRPPRFIYYINNIYYIYCNAQYLYNVYIVVTQYI